MVTFNNCHSIGYCMEADSKPTTGIENGAELREMDTAKVYHFDEENATWVEWTNTSSDDSGSDDSGS